MFHGVSFRLLHNPPLDDIKALLTRLHQDGCDAISIIPHHYCSLQPGTANLAPPPKTFPQPWFIYPDQGQDPDHPFHNTPEPELVLETAKLAASMGFQVMLKPHVDSYAAGWRGFISVKDLAADWVWAYRNRFLKRYLDIARQVDGSILCLGCELYTVTKELTPDFWISLASWVRGQGFSGPLTYAANWGWADDAEYRRLESLWPQLDYIGVDAYFPLVAQGQATPGDVDGLVAGWHRKGIDADWCPPIDDDLLSLIKKAGKPLLFAEIGYGNHQQAALEPGRDPQPNDVVDNDLQLRLAKAFRKRWGSVPEVAGYFWWEAALPQEPKPAISHDILGQPVEQIIFHPLPGEITASGVSSSLESAPAAAQHIGVNDRPHGPNYAVESVPTISPAVFAKWLSDHHSPILQEADALTYYRAIMDKGINPAFALAFFHHESTDATDADGVVVRYGTKNWGNLRPVPGGGLGRAVRAVQTEWGPFRVYKTYLDGLLDWCDLMLTSTYRGKSVPAALQIYAPSSDNNDPNKYANIVLGLVALWDQQSGDFDIPSIGAPAGDGGVTSVVNTPPTPDFPLLGRPTIPVDTFTQTLTAARSPVLDEAAGADYFSLCVNSGVDPTVALAFFQQENNYGTAPGAADHKNWGNLWDAAANALQTYPSWRAGLADWCHRLQGPAYTAHGDPTIAGIVPIYRPAGARQNGNAWYISQLAATITGLQTMPRVAAGSGLESAPPIMEAQHIGVGDRPHGPDYPIVSVPTISPEVFARVLESYQSPALGEAAALDYYRIIIGSGINPAVALAIFEHETHCGTDPDSPTVQGGAKSWANLRPRLDGSLGRGVRMLTTPYGAFRGYDSYRASLLDWCDLMLGRPYQGKGIAGALRLFAPETNLNDPNSYANVVLTRIAGWDEASGAFDIPGTGASAALESAGGLEAAPALQIEWVGASSANFWTGRQGHTAIAIINHEMQGTMAGTRSAFWDPAHQATAHYGVGQDGHVVQFVKEADTAWANGPIRNPNAAVVPWIAEAVRNGTNPNTLTVSIEWEGSQDGKWTKVTWGDTEYDNLVQGSVTRWFTPTPAQYQAGLALIRAIAGRWNIPFDRAHIGRHSDVDAFTKWFCPGEGFPLQGLLDDLNGTPSNGAQGGSGEQPATGQPDFPLLGPASISADTFTQALAAAHSPALDEAAGADYYNLCVGNGVDPTVALAFFQQESNSGTAPGATDHKNWGNLWDPQANALQTYPAWRAGLADWCHRLQGPAYTAHGAPTIASIVPIYQPAGALQNGNDWYIGQLRDKITRLRTA